VELDRVVVDDLDALDLGVVASRGHLLGRIEHALERGLDVARGEGAAIVELHALAQLDLPGGVVQRFPRQGEIRHHPARLEIAHGQVIEDVVAEDDRLAQHGIGRVPGVDVRLERVDERVVPGLRVCRRRAAESQKQEQGRSTDERAAHGGLLGDDFTVQRSQGVEQ